MKKERGPTELFEELTDRERLADEGGGPARQARQHRLGRLNARERIALLVDERSFTELGRHVKSRHAHASLRLAQNQHPGDGLVCGLATVEGRTVAVYAHDPTVLRGAFGHEAAKKLVRLLELAKRKKLPVIALVDSEGVRVEEGTDAIRSFGEVIGKTLELRGQVPQLTLACGLCVGGAAYTAVLTDVVGMVKNQSFMMVTGSKVTRVVTGEQTDLESLGGWALHAQRTGSCHAVLEDERAGVAWMKRVLGQLVPRVPSSDPEERRTPELAELIPTQARRPYDMRRVLTAISDAGSVLELSESFAPNLITALARMGGRAVGIVASQPSQLAGCLDVKASRKGAAFVERASNWGLPLLTLVDVPGYLPGVGQEEEGILVQGASLLESYARSRSPKICLVLRKSFGGASVLSFAADVRFALPTARVDPMGPEGTLEVVLGPERVDATPEEKAEREAAKVAWLNSHDTVWAAAEEGYLDQVLHPAEVRPALCRALRQLGPSS